MEMSLFHHVLMTMLTSSVCVLTLLVVIIILQCETGCKSKCKSGEECCGSGNCSTEEEAPKQEEKGYTGTDC